MKEATKRPFVNGIFVGDADETQPSKIPKVEEDGEDTTKDDKDEEKQKPSSIDPPYDAAENESTAEADNRKDLILEKKQSLQDAKHFASSSEEENISKHKEESKKEPEEEQLKEVVKEEEQPKAELKEDIKATDQVPIIPAPPGVKTPSLREVKTAQDPFNPDHYQPPPAPPAPPAAAAADRTVADKTARDDQQQPKKGGFFSWIKRKFKG